MNWPPLSNEPAPALDSRWQAELNAIFGMTPTGLPFARLVWGMTEREYYHEQMRIKYPCGRNGTTGEVIGTPRWFVESWKGPGIACKGWKAERYEWKYDPDKGIHRNVDMLGPPPVKGIYETVPYRWPFMLAEHQGDRLCCKNRMSQGLICFGELRGPNAKDLQYFRALKAAMVEETQYGQIDEATPLHVIEQANRDGIYKRLAREQKDADEERYRIRNILMTHSKRLTSEGSGLDKFKYNDMSPSWKKHAKNQEKDKRGNDDVSTV